MEYRIGFKGKYYKLYEFFTSTHELYGKTYRRENYKFVKNISMNKEKAAEKYPNAIFDEFANNQKYTFFYKQEQVIFPDKFHCGKYCGKSFDMCNDYDYMKWFYNDCANDEQKAVLEPILKENGFIMHEDKLISNEKLNELKERETRRNKSIEKLEKNLPFIVFMAANVHTDGTYFDKQLQIKLLFERCKSSYWNEIYYGMPIDSTGKARRVKGKQLLILRYIFDGEVVNVIEWKFA